MNTNDRAFIEGWHYGQQHGPVSPREADSMLRWFDLPTNDCHVTLFCNGASDGARDDDSRYPDEAMPIVRRR